MKQALNPSLNLLGVVLTMYDKRTSLSDQVKAELVNHFGDKVFETVIPRNVRLAEAPSFGRSIAEHDKWSKGARAYKSLAKELEKKAGGMSAKQSLGRGFDVLIPKDFDSAILEEDQHRVQALLITDIKPNPGQPRRTFSQPELDELSTSIKRHGVLQPIIVVRSGNSYEIVAGERRWRAAKAAGLKNIPAIVRSLEELERIELSLIENIQRVDLSPLEQAMSVYKLQHQFNLELEKIAEKLGKAPSTVSNIARLLQLPDSARHALEEGKISEGHARAILALRANPAKQEELLRYILNNSWTVRQAEQFAVAAKKGSTTEKAKARAGSESGITRKLSQKLGSPVKVKHLAKTVQLIIEFKSEAELEQKTKNLF